MTGWYIPETLQDANLISKKHKCSPMPLPFRSLITKINYNYYSLLSLAQLLQILHLQLLQSRL